MKYGRKWPEEIGKKKKNSKQKNIGENTNGEAGGRYQTRTAARPSRAARGRFAMKKCATKLAQARPLLQTPGWQKPNMCSPRHRQCKQRQTARGRDRQAGRWGGRQVDRQTGRQTGRQTNRQTRKQTDPTDRRAGRQAGRQAGRLTDKPQEHKVMGFCTPRYEKAHRDQTRAKNGMPFPPGNNYLVHQ